MSTLAPQEEGWYDLFEFLSAFHDALQLTRDYGAFGRHWSWSPQWDKKDFDSGSKENSEALQNWMTSNGIEYANRLMVTLPALGLIERGVHGPQGKRHAFRFTPLGRAVFGAPEVEPPAVAEEQPFFIVQPNFDILAYLDQASAPAASFLGGLSESGAQTGGVQSFRLTHASVYRALEGGRSLVDVVDFLRRHSRNTLPPNVVQTLSDWGARHESMVLRSHVTLVGFPSEAERDAWVTENKGQPIGSRFVLALASKAATLRKSALEVDHRAAMRATWNLDDQGWITLAKPLDIVQQACLSRIAENTGLGWRLTKASAERTKAAGLKDGWIEQWVMPFLSSDFPPLLRYSMRAWRGECVDIAMEDVILLRISDEGLFEALSTSERMKPFIKAIPRLGWLAIRPEAKKQLKAYLDELGFSMTALS